MPDEWDECAGDWDSDADVMQYAELAFACLKDVVSLSGARVLDFGCGTGRLTAKIAQHAAVVVGLDTSPEMLAVLRGKGLPNVETIGSRATAS